MQENEVANALLPSPKQVLDLIVDSERHRKFVWTAGRVLKEVALWDACGSLGIRRPEVRAQTRHWIS